MTNASDPQRPSNWTLASKVQVTRKPPILTAIRQADTREVTLADGSVRVASIGDWLITQGAKIILDIVPSGVFPGVYAIHDASALSLSLETRERLESTLGAGTTRTAEQVVAAVERLASIHIGEVKIDFTPGQWEEIAQRATRRGRMVAQEVQQVVDRIREEIFWRN